MSSLRIDRIELWHIAAPLAAPFEPSWIPGLAQTENRFTLVRLATRDGIEGWSAAPAMGRERQGLGSLLGPYFLGERADDIGSVRQRIREIGYLGIRAGWIEPACWDLVGRARGETVHQLLGGNGGEVRLYASCGELRSVDERVCDVLARFDEGFDTVKLRVHAATLEEDVAHIRGVREAVGEAVRLGVDANQGWRVAVVADAPLWDFDRALAFCREAEALGYDWVEEPLAMDDFDGLARLTAATDIAVAGGELHGRGLPEFEAMIARRCYDVFQPDAIFTGGIAETWAIARRVTAAGLRYTPHTWSNGIGLAINLQLFAATPDRDDLRLEYPLEPPGWTPEGRDALLTEPWHHTHGGLEVPTAPGLGFAIDHHALRRWGTRFFLATPTRVAVRALRDRGFRQARRLGATRKSRLKARSKALDRQIAAGTDPLQATLTSLEPKDA